MRLNRIICLLILHALGCLIFTNNQINAQELNMTGKMVTVYTTADSTNLRLTQTGKFTIGNAEQPLETEVCVFVNPKKVFQDFIGIGGALTDASAEVFAKLPDAKQKELLKAYYDKENGIGYTLARTNIHSCDFSSGMYTYVEEGDKDLKTFTVEHDKQYRIPFIKKAIETAGGKLTLFASPWSPPAFMKNTNDMLHGGKLLPEFYEPWAMYFTKFIKAYENLGIPVWAITVQNEPMAKQTWESCIFTAAEERDFLKNYLGPVMQREGLGDKKIIIWDHNRDLMNYRVSTIMEDKEAAKYAWGIGFHWYEPWSSGGLPMYENVGAVHESYPDKHLIFTEGCASPFNPERYQYWENGEKYGSSMINDFNNGTEGWTDWNVLLDETGGPNHVSNFCFAPVHADVKTGELIYTPSYYYIGHFSKFIRPGARRISSVPSRSQLLTTSFKNADGTNVTVVMNQSDLKITYKMYVGSDAAVKLEIPPHAIQTLVY